MLTDGPGDVVGGSQAGAGEAGGSSADRTGEDFALQGGAGKPRRVKGKLSQAEYAEFFGTSSRTIKRWVELGKDATPVDLPPLDEPGRMAGWWRRHSNYAVPEKLLELEGVLVEAVASEIEEVAKVAAVDSGEKVGKMKEREVIDSITLGGLKLEDNAEVRQARSVVQANFMQLDKASQRGDADGVRRWQPLWARSVEQLRKVEKSAREAAEARGRLVDRLGVEAEIAQLLEALRLARLAMPGRIVAALGGMTSKRGHRRLLRALEPKLIEVVEGIRAREDELFSNIRTLRGPAEFEERLKTA